MLECTVWVRLSITSHKLEILGCIEVGFSKCQLALFKFLLRTVANWKETATQVIVAFL
jgi:hypothetical protein